MHAFRTIQVKEPFDKRVHSPLTAADEKLKSFCAFDGNVFRCDHNFDKYITDDINKA